MQKTTSHVNRVGNAVGRTNICNMWKDHFSQLYNCVPDGGAKADFYTTADSSSNNYTTCVTVRDIISAINQQKKDKSPGPNELAMESFIYGGLKLHVHLSLLVTFFLRHSYVPCTFMKSVILPHVKNKSGNITDPDIQSYCCI